MDDLRQRLLEQKLGDLLDWRKPQVIQTIGPYDPSVFDNFEALLAEAVNLLRERLEGYTDAEIGILVDKESEDLDGLRKDWMSILGDATEKRLRNPPPWYAGGLGHPDYQADFAYWARMPHFSIAEITCLSVGIKPEIFSQDRLDKLARQQSDKLWPAIHYLKQRYEQLVRQFGKNNRVLANRFAFWAMRLEFDMPARFLDLLKRYHVDSYAENAKQNEPPREDKREIDKVAQLLLAMAIGGYGYNPDAKRSIIPREITNAAAELGIDIHPDTIRKYFRIGASFLPPGWQASKD